MASELERNTYDQYADRYAQSVRQTDGDAFSFNHDLVIPRLLAVAGDVDGLSVLDAGCGEGIVSRLLAGGGAKVTAVDVSPRLIELARAVDEGKGISYMVHDLSRPLAHYERSFDVVVSNLVLNDVPDYRGFAATLGSVLKPGGRLILSFSNPYSTLIRQKVQSYFDNGTAVLYPWPDMEVYFYHRTMEDYMTAFRDAGCLLQSLFDLRVTDEMVARMPRKRKQIPWFDMYQRFPFFMILELIKGT